MGQVFNYICLDFWSILFELSDPARFINQVCLAQNPTQRDTSAKTNMLNALPSDCISSNSILEIHTKYNAGETYRDKFGPIRLKGVVPHIHPHDMKIAFFYCGPTSMPMSGPPPSSQMTPTSTTPKNPPQILLTDTGPTIAMSECFCKGKKVGQGERRLVASSPYQKETQHIKEKLKFELCLSLSKAIALHAPT